ncbi:DUF721 domain-containing protein [Georgenia sp. Z1344]|uniref:DUF721 domain-containing protein n=1 Tax=Georgenia sp. Z1344 TaxID=3416706 RepID=UPI003CFAE383
MSADGPTTGEDVDAADVLPASPDALAHAVLARARAAAWDKGLRTTPAPRRRGGWVRGGPDDTDDTDDGTAPQESGSGRPWRPGPGLGWAGSGSSPSRRDPQLLGSIGAQLVRRRGWGRELSLATVVTRWREIVGEQVADHCEVETFAEGELVLRTSSTAWATQVRLLLPQLERRIEEEAGAGTVTSITVLGPGGPSWKHGRFAVRGGRGPRDTYG